MRTILGRWVGIFLIIGAGVLYLFTGRVVDIPGPVETAKSNYIVTHTTASTAVSLILCIIGVALVAMNFKSRYYEKTA